MSVRVQVPADVDREDRLLGDLTGRQVLTLVVAALLGWLVWSLTGPAHLVWCVAALTPIAVVAALLTWGRRDGVPLDRLAVAALRQRMQTPGRRGPRPPEADRDATPGSSRAGAVRGGRGRLVAPRVPVRGVHSVTTELGVVDLGPRGMAVVCTVTPIPLALRSESEQDAAVAGLGAWLSALSGPVQILTRTRHLDLAEVVEATAARAGRLPHPALAAAASDHAAHLAALAADSDLTTREHLLVFRDPTPARPHGSGPGVRGRAALTAVEVLWRRADEATALLGRLGLHVRALDAPTAADVLRAATCPDRRTRDPIRRTHPAESRPRQTPRPTARPTARPTPQPGPPQGAGPARSAHPVGPNRQVHPGRGPGVDDTPTEPLGPIRHLRPTGHDTGRDAPQPPAALGPDGTGWPRDPGPDDDHVEASNDDVHTRTGADQADGWWPGRIRAALDDPDEGRQR